MHDAGDKEATLQARVNSPELHPLMAVTPLNAASALNNPNGTHTERNAPIRSGMPMTGIDDGFLSPANPNGGSPRNGDDDDEGPTVSPPREGPREREDPVGREWPAREFPVPDLAHIPKGRGGVDINVYAHKKTLAQGMMDLALLSANANQLRYVLDTGPDHPYYYVGLVLISSSIALQLVVGVGLILNSRYNIRHIQDVRMADIVNNVTVLGIFFITMLNVFISAFGVGDVPNTPSLPGDSAPPDRLVDS